ncbi:S-adenosyl-L-methionine-dependent methyltransferase [Schizopora paradoxa]|uniref:S-adenosyl-L-methionine-dependent methyltransferase n=1 Tax=Schizopora paradoxa TaxID=27342 RepID=A0A0H2RVY5_9AGAM|nr:S-adenosyl-L-methionine-dependent methyltransferase [Schizopora paradoxa]
MKVEGVTDAYVLPRDEGELQRLNLQYAYLKRLVTDGRVIYDKGVDITSEFRLLDSATGTGAWALDAAEQLPTSVEIHAADLSSNNFPPSPPSNVHFSLASVTNLPQDWTESFDFVNQRLLFGALLRKQWTEALSEIYRVLKPGGAVQFVEIDLYHPVPESPTVMHYCRVHEETFKKAGLFCDVGRNLHDLLLGYGFIGVKSEARHNPMGKMWGEIGMQGAKAFGGALRKAWSIFVKEGAVKTKEEYDKLMDRVEQEWDEQGTQYHCMIVTARKPFV